MWVQHKGDSVLGVPTLIASRWVHTGPGLNATVITAEGRAGGGGVVGSFAAN